MEAKSSIRARRRTIAVATLAALLVVTAAFAASWTAEGDGKARARAGKVDPVLATEAAPTGELLPGESAYAALALTNPNKIAMVVTSIVGNGPITSDSAACDTAGHGVTFTDAPGSWAIAKNSVLNVSLPNAAHMALDSANECQNATFSIPVRVTASATNNGGGSPTTTAAPSTTSTTLGARLSITPTSHNFGPVLVGAFSAIQVFDVRNIGDAQDILRTPDPLGADFEFIASCGGVILGPGGSCPMQVRFAPKSAGAKGANIRISTSRSNDSVQASISGQAQTPAQLTMTPGGADFGTLGVGPSSSPVVFNVTNVGDQPTGPLQVVVSGTNATDFTIASSTCPPTLGAGQSCQVSIVFRPSASGGRNATLTVGAAPGGSVVSTLSGTGAAA